MTSEPLDVRLLPAAVTVWLVTTVGLGWTTGRALAGAAFLVLAGGALALLPDRPPGGPRRAAARMIAASLVIGAGALAVAGLRTGAVQAGPIPELAREGAQVDVTGTIMRDPIPGSGPFGPRTVVTISVIRVEGRGLTTTGRSPILVLADGSWQDVQLGDRVSASGRLTEAHGVDLAAVLLADAAPVVEARAGWAWRGVAGVRAAIWDAVEPVSQPQQALIPALVDGDDSQIPDDMIGDFQETGLTHVLAVSGSNLTLVLGFVLLVARWVGVRGRWLAAVGMLTVVFFVLLARPEPSVLRAAAMGVVGLVALSAGSRARAMRLLCVAVLALLLFDPWLARSVGFLLSSLATAGIVLLAPGWRDALSRWMPRVIAEAIAVPMAAQVACTPVIAAISGRVSIVAVVANLAAAPAVGPTTVLGLIAGCVDLVSRPLGRACGWGAGFPSWWIVEVARTGASLRGASIGWDASTLGLCSLTVLCLSIVWMMPRVLGRPVVCAVLAIVMVVAVLRPWGRLGWPPAGWLLVMCDIGQGDALVVNVGEKAAAVIDAGPDPSAVDRCLDDLDVAAVPLLVLTHFHADHIDGLSGVLDGRRVGEIEVSPLPVPSAGAEAVSATAAGAHLPIRVASPGQRWKVGPTTWEVVGPLAGTSHFAGDDSVEGSVANNASIVLRLEISGHTFLLAGDAEPEEEDEILATGLDLSADVVKVSHHGSAAQDPTFYAATQADIALISVGADNDYGHPAAETLGMLEDLGIDTYRTDQDGTVAVVDRDGELAVVTSQS
jgi:competence protein ComEC